MAKADVLKPFIISWEGGFVNDPYDRGGATNKGVTIGTFRSVYGKNKTVDDLKAITDEQWLHIFKVYFWDKWRADDIINQSVANILVDWVWASGPATIKKVQRILGVAIDGVVGPKTLAALNARNPQTLFCEIKLLRQNYINSIAVGTQSRYKNGWTRRLNSIQFGKLVYANGKTIVNC